jgi:hypothetical protein
MAARIDIIAITTSNSISVNPWFLLFVSILDILIEVSVMAELADGKVVTVVLEQEMRSSFLDYAMSVIVDRALPDVRDGLKPVHRRI